MTISKFVPSDHQKDTVWKAALSNAGDSAGDALALLNPWGADVIVTDLFIDVTTAASGACTIDVGTAANGTTSSDNLIDGLDVNAATGVFGSVDDKGVNGKHNLKWASDEYLTVSTATGAIAGLVANLYVEVRRV